MLKNKIDKNTMKSLAQLLKQSNTDQTNGKYAYSIILKDVGSQPGIFFFSMRKDVTKFNYLFKLKRYQQIWNMLTTGNNQYISNLSDLRKYI